MKIYARITLLKSQVDSEILAYCNSLNPDGMMPGGWTARLPLEDHNTQVLLDMLTSVGLSPQDPGFNKRKQQDEYFLHLERAYSHEELKDMPYLEPLPENFAIHTGGRNRDGEIVLEEYPTHDLSIALWRTWYVVSQRLRQLIEHAQLIGAGFRSMPLEGKIARRKSTTTDWWELTSPVTLPPLAPSMNLLSLEGPPLAMKVEPFDGDYTKGIARKDGRFIHAELRYRGADLEEMPTFDFALTYEMFGRRPDKYDRPLVVSNRFYHLCVENGVQTNWAPVHIE